MSTPQMKLLKTRLRQAFAFKFGRRASRKLTPLQAKIVDRIGPHLPRGGYFIEAGANDGITGSNTLRLEKTHGMRGLLVDPNPLRYVELVRNRGERNRCYCAALVASDFPDDMVRMVNANLMTVAVSMDGGDVVSLDAHLAHARANMKPDEPIFEFGSVARTVSSILDECNAPETIDFFSLDVEGFELNVLRGFDFSARRIDHLVVEARNVERVSAFLSGHGMILEEQLSSMDYWFRRR